MQLLEALGWRDRLQSVADGVHVDADAVADVKSILFEGAKQQ